MGVRLKNGQAASEGPCEPPATGRFCGGRFAAAAAAVAWKGPSATPVLCPISSEMRVVGDMSKDRLVAGRGRIVYWFVSQRPALMGWLMYGLCRKANR